MQPLLSMTITRFYLLLCLICSKFIDSVKLNEFKGKIIIILCHLKTFFLPSSLCDIIVYLPVHLLKEIKFCKLIMYHIAHYAQI